MLQCVAHDVYLLFNELAAYAHYTRFVLIVNGCAMAQALVTRALTHCQRGCTLLSMASMAGWACKVTVTRATNRRRTCTSCADDVITILARGKSGRGGGGKGRGVE